MHADLVIEPVTYFLKICIEMEEVMKTKIWTYSENLGDGSVTVRFFNSEEDAEAYAELDNERNCDDIQEHVLVFDNNGKLLNPSTI